MKFLFKGLFFSYVLLCLFVYFAQERIIFHPHQYPNDEIYQTGKEIEIPLTSVLSMNALLVYDNAKYRSQKAILYLHGNKGNVKRGQYQTRQMKDLGYDILIPDYRGYGKTEGKIVSNQQLLEDAEKAYLYLNKHYKEEDIVIVGYSLGTGMASYIAQEHNPRHLILLAPFTSLTDIKNEYLWFLPDFLLKYKLDNAAQLPHVESPVTIIHGTKDNVVDFRFSTLLKQKMPSINLITLPGQNHRGVIFDPSLRRVIKPI